MKRGPLRLRLQKQSQSGQQDNNGRISETGNKYFFGISCENTPILENNNRHISKNTKDWEYVFERNYVPGCTYMHLFHFFLWKKYFCWYFGALDNFNKGSKYANVITWKHSRTLYFIHKIPKYCSYQLFWKVDSIWNLYWSHIKANRGQAVSRHLRSHVQLSTQTHRKRRFTKSDRKHTWPKKKGQILDNFLVFGLLRSQIRIDIMQFWHLDLWRRTKLIPNVLEL